MLFGNPQAGFPVGVFPIRIDPSVQQGLNEFNVLGMNGVAKKGGGVGGEDSIESIPAEGGSDGSKDR